MESRQWPRLKRGRFMGAGSLTSAATHSEASERRDISTNNHPLGVISRAAQEAGLSAEEFLDRYQAVFHYGTPPGACITFESRVKAAL